MPIARAGCTTFAIQVFVVPTIWHRSLAGVENATPPTAETFHAFLIPQAPLPSTVPIDTASATDFGSIVHWPDGGRTPTVVKSSVRFGVDEQADSVTSPPPISADRIKLPEIDFMFMFTANRLQQWSNYFSFIGVLSLTSDNQGGHCQMYTIYTSPGTGGFAAEAMLEAGTAPWRREIIDTDKDEHRTAGYLAINPAAQVPALILPSGELMTESAAICMYLGDAHSDTGLAPQPGDPGRAAYLRWMVYLTAVVYAADLRCYYPDRYTSDVSSAEAVKSCAIENMNASFTIIDEHLSRHEWLADKTMSVADIYLAMLASWHPDIAALKLSCPRVAGVWDKVAKVDFVKKTNAFHQLW